MVLLGLAVLVLLLEGQGSLSAHGAAGLGRTKDSGVSQPRICQTQVRAPSYLQDAERGGMPFPGLRGRLREGQGS